MVHMLGNIQLSKKLRMLWKPLHLLQIERSFRIKSNSHFITAVKNFQAIHRYYANNINPEYSSE